ncbi:LysM peptidoglycan-binding domain-containing protein [Bacillus sp. FJAT-45350]|uniref:LysM peptidoglycan-binding domain-containing protein n=1 Tax=Bacillus sp. FJAT-45350 TaxID=2011014 RepID=UPI000BB80253|nr:LysM peptidoglycan-binding domain-containing protein [Bacillus sp. FJAT-45350]
MLKVTLLLQNTTTAVTLPIPPEKIDFHFGARTMSFTTIYGGAFDMPRGRNPEKVILYGLLPGPSRQLPVIVEKNAQEVVEVFRTWNKENKPLRLIIPDTKINLPVYIEKFDAPIEGGYGDYRYTLALGEYRQLVITSIGSDGKVSTAASPTQNSKPRTHTVKSGDTLWRIAQDYYKDGSKYRDIFQANRDKIDNPDRIFPGQVLKIP